ncbi:MAG: ribose 1,5-bisphosphate isomerase, partial [Euryarchaeota archaeon]|nr:ribose 1,5-bisphosphate isomerase [Euryarchaeota archaeon]
MKIPAKILKIAKKIQNMEIRGAGKTARAGAEALRIMAFESKAPSREKFLAELREVEELLLKTRPTAVSLPNAFRFVIHRVE